MNIFDFYNNKKVLVTGHTGFKGSWLCFFLNQMGAKLYGYSLKPDTHQKKLFDSLRISKYVHNEFSDLRDVDSLCKELNKFNPEIIFHLAAQPLVIESYKNPIKTFATNIIGTANLLEVSRGIKSVKAIINITSDKCYENLNDKKEYIETDRLGGFDPYSASKSCAEIINQSYQKSFFNDSLKGLASARAGNVIGGGDFSTNRLFPDIIRSASENKVLKIRNPNSTRPWQHVFDVIYGYLLLGEKLYENPSNFSSPFNFSPEKDNCIPVTSILEKMRSFINFEYEIQKNKYGESSFLSLNSKKARSLLNWENIYDINDTISVAYKWYNCFLNNNDIYNYSLNQFENYMEDINGRN